MGVLHLGCVFLALLSLASALTCKNGPCVLTTKVERGLTCASTCSGSNKFHFSVGSGYKYDFKSDVEVKHPDVTTRTGYKLAATAIFSVIDDCEFSLKLSDVSLESQTASGNIDAYRLDHFIEELERDALRFSMDGGVLGNVCPETDQDSWTMNIKRSVISHLQNSQESLSSGGTFTENDVYGWCKVDYSVQGSSVTKKRDYASCKGERGYGWTTLRRPYRDPHAQSESYILSEQMCEQRIENGVIRHVVCEEKHSVNPQGSTAHFNATVKVESRLDFQTKVGSQASGMSEVPRNSIQFDYRWDIEGHAMTSHQIRKVDEFQELFCDSVSGEANANSAMLYLKGFRLVRTLDRDSIKILHDKAKAACPAAAKTVLDIMSLAVTPPVFDYLLDLIINEEVDEMFRDSWLTMLPNILVTDPAYLPIAQRMMGSNLGEKATLSAGGILHSFCVHDPDCANNKDAQSLAEMFTSELKSDCPSGSHREEKRMIEALKGLGNAGWAGAADTLVRCFNNEYAPKEARVLAIKAFHKMPCVDVDLFDLENLFKDADIWAEMRIAAYQKLILCPTEMRTDAIIDNLDESVGAVNSYIFTNVRSCAADDSCSVPCRMEMKKLFEKVEEDDMTWKFNRLNRKFGSANYRKTWYNDRKQGVTLDTSFVHSGHSILPQSVSTKLVTDMYGYTQEWLELGLRSDNFDRNIFDILSGRADMKDMEGAASFYIKMFNNELRYGDVAEMMQKLQNPSDGAPEFLKKLMSDGKYETSKAQYSHSPFSDGGMWFVPSMAGLPMWFVRDSTSIFTNEMELPDYTISSSKISITGSVYPRMSNLKRDMVLFDAHVDQPGFIKTESTRIGIRMAGKLDLVKGKKLSIEFNMKDTEHELMNWERNYYSFVNDKLVKVDFERSVQMDAEECLKPTGTLLGEDDLQICMEGGEYSTSPQWIENGPASFRVFTKKGSFKGLRAEITKTMDMDGNKGELVFVLGKIMQPEQIRVQINCNPDDGEHTIKMTSPRDDTHAEGMLKIADDLVSLTFDAQTPLPGFETVKLEAERRTDGENVHGKWELSRTAGDSKITYDIIKTEIGPKTFYSFNGNIDSHNSVFDGMMAKYEVTHEKKTDASSIAVEAEARWADDKAITLKGAMRYNGRNKMMPVWTREMKITTPFTGLRTIAWEAELKVGTTIVEYDLKLNHDRGDINLFLKREKDGEDISLIARFTSPYNNMERIVLTHDITHDEGIRNGILKLELAPDKIVQVKTAYGYKGPSRRQQHRYLLWITSPHELARDVGFDIDVIKEDKNHKMGDYAYLITGTYKLKWGPDKEIFVDGDALAVMDGSRMVHFHRDYIIKTPFENYHDVKLDQDWEMKDDSFKYESSLNYDGSTRRTLLEVEHDWPEFKAKLELSNPFPSVEMFTIEMENEEQDDGRFITITTANYGSETTVQVQTEFCYHVDNDVNQGFSNLDHCMSHGGNELDDEYRQYLHMKMKALTPGSILSDNSAELEHTYIRFANGVRKTKTKGELEWAPGKAVTLAGESEYRSEDEMVVYRKGDVTVTTPFDGYREIKADSLIDWKREDKKVDIDISVDVDGQIRGFNVATNYMMPTPALEVIVNFSPEEEPIKVNIDATIGRVLKVNFGVTRTISEFPNAGFSFEMNGTPRSFTSTATAKYNNKEVEATVTFSNRRNVITTKLNLQTPFYKFKEITFDFKRTGGGLPCQSSCTNEFSLANRSANREWKGRTEYSNKKGLKLFKIDLNTPLGDLRAGTKDNGTIKSVYKNTYVVLNGRNVYGQPSKARRRRAHW